LTYALLPSRRQANGHPHPGVLAGPGEKRVSMANYSSNDVEQLLQVKAHVIRYWEKEIPLIQPVKDIYGRRTYRDKDLQILFRLKYLLYDRRFTIEGAKTQLYQELTGEKQDLRSCIAALRSELLSLYFFVHDSSEVNEDEPA
jgi:DNA-binding transcriptional MerR regulator